MRCIRCDGRLMCISSYQTRGNDIFKITRRRRCEHCGYEFKTTEMLSEKVDNDYRFVKGIKNLIQSIYS